MGTLLLNDSKAGATLLILGGLVFWAGAFSPPYKQWSATYEVYLEVIHQHKAAWIFINAAMGLGVIVTIFGINLLAQRLNLSNDLIYGNSARVAFTFGAAFWIIHLVYRLSVEPWLAGELAEGNSLSGLMTAFHQWNGILFSVYMVLAYLSLALLGLGLLATGMLPAWVGWVALIFGLAGAVGFPTGILFFEPPLMIHVVPIIIGVVWWIKG